MKISDVMTRDVQTVTPDQTAREAASFMLSADTGAIPVTEGDRLGVESWVGDLLGSPGLRISYPDGRGGHLVAWRRGERPPPPLHGVHGRRE